MYGFRKTRQEGSVVDEFRNLCFRRDQKFLLGQIHRKATDVATATKDPVAGYIALHDKMSGMEDRLSMVTEAFEKMREMLGTKLTVLEQEISLLKAIRGAAVGGNTPVPSLPPHAFHPNVNMQMNGQQVHSGSVVPTNPPSFHPGHLPLTSLSHKQPQVVDLQPVVPTAPNQSNSRDSTMFIDPEKNMQSLQSVSLPFHLFDHIPPPPLRTSQTSPDTVTYVPLMALNSVSGAQQPCLPVSNGGLPSVPSTALGGGWFTQAPHGWLVHPQRSVADVSQTGFFGGAPLPQWSTSQTQNNCAMHPPPSVIQMESLPTSQGQNALRTVLEAQQQHSASDSDRRSNLEFASGSASLSTVAMTREDALPPSPLHSRTASSIGGKVASRFVGKNSRSSPNGSAGDGSLATGGMTGDLPLHDLPPPPPPHADNSDSFPNPQAIPRHQAGGSDGSVLSNNDNIWWRETTPFASRSPLMTEDVFTR